MIPCLRRRNLRLWDVKSKATMDRVWIFTPLSAVNSVLWGTFKETKWLWGIVYGSWKQRWSRSWPFLFFFFNLFIHSWLCWVCPAERRLSPAEASWGCSSLRCTGLSLWGLLLLLSTVLRVPGLQSSWLSGSVVVAGGLKSCGTQAELLCGL